MSPTITERLAEAIESRDQEWDLRLKAEARVKELTGRVASIELFLSVLDCGLKRAEETQVYRDEFVKLARKGIADALELVRSPC